MSGIQVWKEFLSTTFDDGREHAELLSSIWIFLLGQIKSKPTSFSAKLNAIFDFILLPYWQEILETHFKFKGKVNLQNFDKLFADAYTKGKHH